jgi:hypothetical protein
MSRYYYSIYGPLIKQFIETKRTFGYKYAMVEQECARFDRFAYDNDEKIIGILKIWQLSGVPRDQTNRLKLALTGFRL